MCTRIHGKRLQPRWKNFINFINFKNLISQIQYTALCFPQCLNGGNCTAPGSCSCPKGFQGRYCEGGICNEKCLNGGKCIQKVNFIYFYINELQILYIWTKIKDKCQCSKGYYGLRCQLCK